MRHAWQLKMHIGLHRLFYPRPREANAISGMDITELFLLDLPYRLVAVADDLLAMVNIDLHPLMFLRGRTGESV
jgi:hypothetical protein